MTQTCPGGHSLRVWQTATGTHWLFVQRQSAFSQSGSSAHSSSVVHAEVQVWVSLSQTCPKGQVRLRATQAPWAASQTWSLPSVHSASVVQVCNVSGLHPASDSQVAAAGQQVWVPPRLWQVAWSGQSASVLHALPQKERPS
jgi:hypothetical protein